MGCSCRSRASLSSSVAASELPTGGLVGIADGFFFLTAVRFWGAACCARGLAMLTLEKQKNSTLDKRIRSAKKLRNISSGTGTEADVFPLRVPEAGELAPQHWRGIWIFAECG